MLMVYLYVEDKDSFKVYVDFGITAKCFEMNTEQMKTNSEIDQRSRRNVLGSL